MRSLLLRLCSYVEFAWIATLGYLLGVGVVVRYLRNPNPRITVRLLRAFGAEVGERTTFKRGVHIDNAYEDEDAAGDFRHLKVGANCYIGDDVYIDLANRVELEDDVVLSGQVALITHADCNRSPNVAAAFPRVCLPIRLKRGAWLAFRATVLAGVTVGEDAVVAAHALVRENALAATVHAGTPAKALRPITPADRAQVELRVVEQGR